MILSLGNDENQETICKDLKEKKISKGRSCLDFGW